MGNYHHYELKSYAGNIGIPEEPFFEESAVRSLLQHGYYESKRWKFDQDIVLVSKYNPDVLITVNETDEDETVLRQHQFFNGEHKWVDGKIVFPEINWF